MPTREEIRAERVAIARAARDALDAEERAARRAQRVAAALEARATEALAMAATNAESLRRQILAPVPEVDNLPRVLLIGDSISMGYTLKTRELVEQANVQRAPANCGGTTLGLANMQSWLGSGSWDLIHFNFGVHDAVLTDGVPQTSVEQYVVNLEAIVDILEVAQPEATLVFATSTPTSQQPGQFADIGPYNLAAVALMQEHGIVVDDLHAAILPRLDDLALPGNIHYPPLGFNFLARHVAASIEANLPMPS